eukprot:730135-Pyramimonas_sp.AAC.1
MWCTSPWKRHKTDYVRVVLANACAATNRERSPRGHRCRARQARSPSNTADRSSPAGALLAGAALDAAAPSAAATPWGALRRDTVVLS